MEDPFILLCHADTCLSNKTQVLGIFSKNTQVGQEFSLGNLHFIAAASQHVTNYHPPAHVKCSSLPLTQGLAHHRKDEKSTSVTTNINLVVVRASHDRQTAKLHTNTLLY